jgi:hypothetical protein
VQVAIESGAWSWGWDALVALGTIGLAIFTALLAVATFQTATTAARDVRATWRPVIVPGEDVEAVWITNTHELRLALRNVGPGAAYGLEVALDTGDGALRPATRFAPGTVRPINFAVVPPGTTMDTIFDHIETEPTTGELTLGYSDLNGRRYGTTIKLRTATAYLPDGEFTALAMTTVAHTDNNEIAVPYEDPRSYAGYHRFPRLHSVATAPMRVVATRFGRRP